MSPCITFKLCVFTCVPHDSKLYRFFICPWRRHLSSDRILQKLLKMVPFSSLATGSNGKWKMQRLEWYRVPRHQATTQKEQEWKGSHCTKATVLEAAGSKLHITYCCWLYWVTDWKKSYITFLDLSVRTLKQHWVLSGFRGQEISVGTWCRESHFKIYRLRRWWPNSNSNINCYINIISIAI